MPSIIHKRIRNIPLSSIRFALTGGVTICLVITAGLIGGLSIWGGLQSAIELTRDAQSKKTKQLSETLTSFTQALKQEAATLTEVIGLSANEMKNKEIVDILSSYAKHKKNLTSITLVRKNRTNVWVGRWKGDVIHEINTELDEESYIYAINGRPNDGGEGFDDIYIEPSEGRPVITYTKHFANAEGKAIGTIYFDLGLKTLSEALSSEDPKSGEITFVFNSDSDAIAHPSLATIEAYKTFEKVPHIKSTKDPVAIELDKIIKTGAKNIQDLRVNNSQWLASVSANNSIGGKTWYFASVIPREVVLGPAIAQAKNATLIALIVISIAIICSQLIGRAITRSLERLAEAADAVQKLELDIQLKEQSYFDELKGTEQAFRAMIGGLGIFAKYVPSGLVKRLMELQASGSTIKAEEREVTILFTDIIGYTSISDGMDPKGLALLLNEYFELLVCVVSKHGGTVDKFIGDALMVFWNAPDNQKHHPDKAIECALEIQNVIEIFNSNRLKDKKQPLATRIGIHTGTVLAGEIGSTERMNYTIVGDSVNTAARLEALGKTVGQTLCISDTTKEKASGSYAWHEIDEIVLRGRSQATTVYTILRK